MSNEYHKHFQMKRRQLQSPKSREKELVELARKELLKRRKNKKNDFPAKTIVYCFASLAILLSVQFFLDDLLSFGKKLEIRVGSPSIAQEKKTPAKKPESEKSSTPLTAEEKKMSAKKSQMSAEELAIFEGLEKRKKELDDREKNLKALATELQQQKAEIGEEIKRLKELREQISSKLEKQVQSDDSKVDKLVAVYSGMKPANAAKVFEAIDEDLAVKILAKMKKNNAASILNLMDTEKARTLSEKFTGYISKKD